MGVPEEEPERKLIGPWIRLPLAAAALGGAIVYLMLAEDKGPAILAVIFAVIACRILIVERP